MSRGRLRIGIGSFVAFCLMLTPGASPATALPGDSATYVSGGTAVARANGEPVVDEGSVVCDGGNDVGVGGVCLAFGGGDAVRVTDQLAGENVAYQVCLDNNGDGVCTSPDSGTCADEVYFSHDDNGAFYNPVGPLPTGFASGCDGGPWQGYVVLLCEGAHVVGMNAHTHAASEGSAEVTTGGEGLGTFCGGGPQPSRKPYKVGSGARYLSGGTAAARNDGQTVVDEGAMTCNNGDNVGVGGFCVSFGGGDSIAVFDDVADMDVAFQACIDNNADGVCTTPDDGSYCADQVFFSHDDAGNFYNPVGPLPTGFRSGCGFKAPWNGYVVFLCEGAHTAGLDAHAHPATAGNGLLTTGGEGLGTFCGGSHSAQSNKRYGFRTDVPDTGLVPGLDPSTRFVVGDGGPCDLVAMVDAVAGQGQITGTLQVGPVTAVEAGAFPLANIRATCFVQVNGATQAGATVSASGTAVAAGSGVVTFTSNDVNDDVQVCAEIEADGQGTTVECFAAMTFEVPPQIVRDLVDPAICALLVPLAGEYGNVVINTQGDVFVEGEPYFDCPPYDL